MSLAFLAGQIITADALNAPLPISVDKSAPQSLASSTTFQNDTELFADLLAGRTYKIELIISASSTGSAVPDIKLSWATTGTIGVIGSPRSCLGPGVGVVDSAGGVATAYAVAAGSADRMRVSAGHAIGTSIGYGIDGVVPSRIQEQFKVICTVAGRLQLQWAQLTSNATNTTVNAGGSLVATPVA